MANTYFQFKQFTIHQERCSLKVCTDACLFGAFVAAQEPSVTAGHCLDIGTGTGLLSLLLAQQWQEWNFDAAEIDPAAAHQARENFADSPWSERLKVIETDILDFTNSRSYDCIISNPPFFEGDLRSEDAGKNNAKHDTALTLPALWDTINRLLKPEGDCWLLLPHHRIAACEQLAAERDFKLHTKVEVKQSHKHSYFRGMLGFSQTEKKHTKKTITITENESRYSEEFTALLKGYYLKL